MAKRKDRASPDVRTGEVETVPPAAREKMGGPLERENEDATDLAQPSAAILLQAQDFPPSRGAISQNGGPVCSAWIANRALQSAIKLSRSQLLTVSTVPIPGRLNSLGSRPCSVWTPAPSSAGPATSRP
jgi:hypothetical protein